MTSALEPRLIDQAWESLAGPARARPSFSELDGDASALASAFPVAETATACVATALLAAGALQAHRNGKAPTLQLDRRHVAAAVRSERYFDIDGAISAVTFAPLSRFWRTADGWVRTHANYPWHREALLRALETRDDELDSVAASIRARSAREVEDAVFAAGGIAAAVRTLDEWRRHGQGADVAREPLIAHRRVGDAPPRARGAADVPLAGVRVLDFTRVIAGPVCTRYLGALGADVLRIDPPHRRDLVDGAPADTLLAKRSAMLDLSTDEERVEVDARLGQADVVVCGYRPGALDHIGLGAEQMIERHPGLVVVTIDAWGHTGPWAARRGFDSVVQAAAGIGAGESSDGDEPGVLPCQLLDHGTGYLAAAAATDGLLRQTTQGGSHLRRLSLARTAAWLTETQSPRARDDAGADDGAEEFMQELRDEHTTIRAVRPPGAVDGRPLQWPNRLTRYANDPATWAS